MNKKQKKMLVRIIASAVLFVVFLLLPVEGWLRLVLFLIPYLIIGYDILLKALKGIKNLQPFDEHFLMAVATIGAIALGEYTEGAAVMLFYQIGELFQSCAVGKSRRNIAQLMDIRPDCAYVEQEDGETEETDPDEVEIGSVLVVKPGEKIPIDGIVLTGETMLDTSALTGESVPRSAKEGDEVISGSISLTGMIRVQTTREFGESTVSKIMDLVENASSRKSKSEAFISRFAKVYTPIVCFAALALAIIMPLVRLAVGVTPEWVTWIYRALTFLVVSCPCALVISIPLTFFAGLGGAGNAGVLIKGSSYLEALADVKTVLFDKTGTVTMGVFEVAGIHHNKSEEAKVLEYAALAECYSNHPISASLRKAWGFDPDESRVSDVKELGGRGVTANVDGHQVACGNERLMTELGIESIPCDEPGTLVHVAIDGVYEGHILISDKIKPTAKEAMQKLKKAGITRTIMLTGDREETAQAVARSLSIDEVHANLLPEQKVEIEEKVIAEKRAGNVAFCGDGVNDAPVLARADVGIAMGALGSDAAIEAADVVLMDDDPAKIAKAVRIAKKCMNIVRENIVFAIGIKVLCLILSAFGIANMWYAIFADVGVMVLAVLNAIRALNVKQL